MSRASVTVHKVAIWAAGAWVATLALMGAMTVYAALHERLGAVGAALLAWALLMLALAVLGTGKCLLAEAVDYAVDEVAMLLDAREAPPPFHGDGASPPSPRRRLTAAD